MVGARSALFLPFADLGLIVVDEEHDGSFKQEDGVCYNARDMAVVRARLVAAPIVLASATPSLESVVNVAPAATASLHLPARHGGARARERSRPIDLRRQPPPRGRWLSPPVVEAMKQDPGRRRADAAVPQSPRLCAAHAVPRLRARASNARNARPGWSSIASAARCSAIIAATPSRRPMTCQSCGAVDQFVACGPGVERLAEEALELFPEARLELFTSDT